jgi:hypothetical protein
LRCDGSLCSEHAPRAEQRCFACEWLGYHLRWLWRAVLLKTGLTLALMTVLVLAFPRSWIAYGLGLPLCFVIHRWHPLSFFDGYKRRLFLAEHLPGLWYEYAIALRRGKVKPPRSS